MAMKVKRRKGQVRPISLTERDIRIILGVYENRFLRRDQIQRLYFPGASLPACNVRLRKLSEHKFLDRIIRPAIVGTQQYVYALDKNGADIVAKAKETGREKIRWQRGNNKVEFLFMDHTLGVSEFRVGLELGLTRTNTELLFYRRGDKALVRRVSDPSGKQKYLIVAPDAFVGITTPKGKLYFFVEVDMATEALKRFQDKVVAYKKYWKSGKYKEDYGFNYFRVLTVAESERRLANLIDATAKAGGKRMFLFTTFAGIENHGIFEPIWLAPLSTEPTSILE